VKSIEERNKRVEINKAWEVSWTRKIWEKYVNKLIKMEV